MPIGTRGEGRRRVLSFAALFAAALLLLSPAAVGFGFDDVSKIAAQRAATSYKPRTDKLPDALAKLDYDHFRDIRFKPDRSLWRPEGLPPVGPPPKGIWLSIAAGPLREAMPW